MNNHESTQRAAEFPGRPPRLKELFEWLSPLYFITFNTCLRQQVLAEKEIHQTLVSFCRAAVMSRVHTGEYVVMPDYVHLIVAFPEIGGPMLGRWMGSLKNILGKRLLAAGVSKPHWQESFFDHVIRSEPSYHEKVDYIRQNPVRAGLCKVPADWPFRGSIVEF